jgi:hypothetical protein
MASLTGPELQKYELTGAGIYKEWWANPAVVGLMGFALTTMATGLHNVGYWGGRTHFGAGNRLRRHRTVHCGHRGPSEREHFRRVRLHVLRCFLVVALHAPLRPAEDGSSGGSSRGARLLPDVDTVHLRFLHRGSACGKVLGSPVLAALAGFHPARTRGCRQDTCTSGRVGDPHCRAARLLYCDGDLSEYGTRQESDAAFLAYRWKTVARRLPAGKAGKATAW